MTFRRGGAGYIAMFINSSAFPFGGLAAVSPRILRVACKAVNEDNTSAGQKPGSQKPK